MPAAATVRVWLSQPGRRPNGRALFGFVQRVEQDHAMIDQRQSERPGQADEKRRGPRRRVLKAGTISFGIAAGIDCVVKNISDTGALLAVESAVGIPNRFTLVIPADSLKREALVKWRRARSIGVAFV